MPTTAAIYSRVSTRDRQETENQLAQLRRYAKRQGWQAVEYIDRASGGTSKRDAFQKLFTDAHQRKFDVLLFWSLDRFSREGALKTLQHLQRLSDYGIKWRSHTQEYLTNVGPFGDAIVALMAALAQQEREVIRARVMAGLQRARKEGKRLGRPRKLFDRDKVHRMKAKGKSYREIGAALGISAMHAYRIAKGREQR